jgi:hypothetical protein
MVLLAHNCFDLQEKIHILEQYFKEIDWSVNLAKTKVLLFFIAVGTSYVFQNYSGEMKS